MRLEMSQTGQDLCFDHPTLRDLLDTAGLTWRLGTFCPSIAV